MLSTAQHQALAAVTAPDGEDELSGLKGNWGGPGEATQETRSGWGWGSLKVTPAAWKPVATSPRSSQPCQLPRGGSPSGRAACVRSPRMHRSLSQSSGTICARRWAQTPSCRGCDAGPPALKPSSLRGGPSPLPRGSIFHVHGVHRPKHSLPVCQLPARRFPRTQALIFPVSANDPDFCSETFSGAGRAWTGASAVPGSGLLGTRRAAGG